MSSIWSISLSGQTVLPDDRVPVEAERLGGEQGAEGDDEGDVEDCRAQHTAHIQGVLQAETYDCLCYTDKKQ